MGRKTRRRVFIIGAGASRYAQFPLGAGLWNFIKTHGHADDVFVETVEKYVKKNLPGQASDFLADIELLLTGLDLRMWRVEREEKSESQGYSEIAEVRKTYRRRKNLAVPQMHPPRASRIRRSLKGLNLEGSSDFRQLLVARIVTAFLMHHECLRWPEVKRNKEDSPPPSLTDLFARAAGYRTRDEAPMTLEANPDILQREMTLWENECPHARFHRRHQANLFGRRRRIVCPCAEALDYRRLNAVEEKVGAYFKPGDILLSFNWDALIEQMLWRRRLWNPLTGYFTPIKVQAGTASRKRFISELKKLPPISPVLLLKLHGSITWSTPSGDQRGQPELRAMDLIFDAPIYSSEVTMLERRPSFDPQDVLAAKRSGYGDWDEEYVNPHTVMIYPTYTKDYSMTLLTSMMWQFAREALAAADEVYVLGFSLPRGDSAARAILADGLIGNRKAPEIRIVNPGADNWDEFADRLGLRINRSRKPFEEWILGQ